MRRDRTRLSRRHQGWLYATFGILFLSGALWLVIHYFFASDGDFGQGAHLAESWLMKVHGAAAMLTLILLGTVLPGHVRRGWNARKNRISGGGFLILNGLLIVSGYALYYFGSEELRSAMSALHWIAGLALPVALAWHVWRGQKLRRAINSEALPRSKHGSRSVYR